MDWKNPTPVVVGLLRVLDDDDAHVNRVLAVQRGIPPGIGQLALPGGYVDELEDAETAIAREVYEETGIETRSGLWRPLTTRVTQRNILLIFMRYVNPLVQREVLTAVLDFKPNSEVQRLELVDETATLCFPTHQEILSRKHLWE